KKITEDPQRSLTPDGTKAMRRLADLLDERREIVRKLINEKIDQITTKLEAMKAKTITSEDITELTNLQHQLEKLKGLENSSGSSIRSTFTGEGGRSFSSEGGSYTPSARSFSGGEGGGFSTSR